MKFELRAYGAFAQAKNTLPRTHRRQRRRVTCNSVARVPRDENTSGEIRLDEAKRHVSRRHFQKRFIRSSRRIVEITSDSVNC